ncbi:TATA box-binding protein-associated factor RNA polymerase I subunit A isoform X2 [Ascaphus truei]
MEETSEEEAESDPGEAFGIRLPELHRDPSPTGILSSKNNGFRKTTDLCFGFIHEALLKNQWQRAADLLANYFQTLEYTTTQRRTLAPEILWRLGNEILLHHPESTLEDINLFNERMKNIGVKNYLEISLEHVYGLLCNGQTEDAYRMLTVAESWRYGGLSASQDKLTKLIQAYRALLDYQTWLNKKAAVTRNDGDYVSQAASAQDMDSLFRQATVTFQEIIKCPGVWDPFVLCYVDLLESSGDHEGVEKLLTDYAYNSKNPANPNAHVYLYEFLKRTRASNETLIKVLKILYFIVPSHQLMLEFNHLLRQSELGEDHQLALQVIFSVLDFSGWKEDVKAWSCLAKQLKKTLKHHHKAWVIEEWQSRKDWWPAYHFTKFHAKKEWKEKEVLAMNKALVSGILLGQACSYFTLVCGLGRKVEKKTLKGMKAFVKKHNCACPS